MRKRSMLLAALVVGLISSSTWALSHIGPPGTTSKKGQIGFNIGGSVSKTDIKLNDFKTPAFPLNSTTIKKVRTQGAFVDLTYGLFNNWEGFLRLTMTELEEGASNFGGRTKVHGDTDMGYGLGIRGTFYRTPKWSVGGVFQIMTIDTDGKARVGALEGGFNMDIWEYLLAVGPTYHVTDWFAIYGGPFMYILDGEVHGQNILPYSAEIKSQALFGGFIGAEFTFTEHSSLRFEYAHTDNLDGLNLGYSYRH